MAHTNYFLDPSYWIEVGGNLQTTNLLSSETPAYIFNPSIINTNGFNKSSANLTLAQVNAYKTVLTAPDGVIPNAADFTLANWTAKGWGSTLADVLTNYNTFIANNFIDSTQKLAINPGFQDVTTYIVSGSINGTNYFVPFLAWANQSSSSLVTGYEGLINPAELTQIVSVSNDDNYVNIPFNFGFKWFGTTYQNNIYLGSNSYVTFGFGSTQYSGLSASNPGRALHFGSADNSYQIVYTKQMTRYGKNAVVIRYEGTNLTSGTPGSPNILVQLTFFEDQKINLTIAQHGRLFGGQVGLSDGVSYQPTYTLAENTSYAISSDANGNNWTVQSGKYFG
jgi:hypothetical protein